MLHLLLSHVPLLHAGAPLATFLQDSDQQTTARAISGMMAGMMGFILLFVCAVVAFFIFLFWRIFTKAGMSGALSLLILIYPIGFLIVVCILAFSDWKVAPIATGSPYFPPVYPPPPLSPPPSTFQPPPQV